MRGQKSTISQTRAGIVRPPCQGFYLISNGKSLRPVVAGSGLLPGESLHLGTVADGSGRAVAPPLEAPRDSGVAECSSEFYSDSALSGDDYSEFSENAEEVAIEVSHTSSEDLA